MTTPRSMKVHIAGLDLAVRTTASEQEVQRLADLIDARLQTVKQGGSPQPLHNDLALVALSLAQELMQTQDLHHQLVEDVESMSGDLLRALEDDDA